MKTLLTSLTMMLLLSILAVCAFAQTEDPAQSQVQLKPEEPVKEQTLDRTFTGETSDGVGTAKRYHTWSGPEAMGAAAGETGEDDMLKVFIDEDGDGFNDSVKVFGEDCDGTQTHAGALENERETHGPAAPGPYVDSEGFGAANDQDVGTGSAVRDRGSSSK